MQQDLSHQPLIQKTIINVIPKVMKQEFSRQASIHKMDYFECYSKSNVTRTFAGIDSKRWLPEK